MTAASNEQHGGREAPVAVSGPAIIWPPVADARDVRCVLPALLATERLPPDRRIAGQLQQLQVLARFADQHAPQFRARLQQAGLQPAGLTSLAALRGVPPLVRRELMQAIERIDCSAFAEAHGPFATVNTSGSSGEPVRLKRTAVTQGFWLAYTMREHLWHQRDFTAPMAVMRANLPHHKPFAQSSWGPPASLFTATGPTVALPINADLSQLVAWLNAAKPAYLLTFPNSLVALLDEVEAGRLNLSAVRQIRSMGETLPAALRQRVHNLLGIRVVDLYSSQELGIIAAECPVSGLYHVSEGLIVEVLDGQGQLCVPGQVGRIVATDLHNFATPLIRYEIGDYAEVGPAEPCPCGRGLQSLRRIAGRERNMLKLPNGERRWPIFGFHKFRDLAPILQFQLVQRSLTEIEVRLVAAPRLDSAQEAAIGAVILGVLKHDFKLSFVYYDEALPRKPNGKFEEFVCEA